MPSPPTSCFLSAGFVGLAQGLLFRRWLAWWSWALVTLIAGGAAMAMAWVLADLDIGPLGPAPWIQACILNATAGAVIGTGQAFLLSHEYRGSAAWPLTSAVGAALFWTGAALVLLPLQQNSAGEEAWRSRILAAVAMGLSWGGLAMVTLHSLRKLEALHGSEAR